MHNLGIDDLATGLKIILFSKKTIDTGCPSKLKKILEVDYPRGRAKEYYANFISAKSLKIEFSLFHPSVSH
ncbi:MAG: hypothetical protein ACK5HT_22300, partial [Draconibacterium sp.]